MITAQCIDELADHLRVKAEVSAITRRAMNGELDFVAALQARVALLEGLPVENEQVFRERIRLMPGARAGADHARWRARTALVSGGFAPFVGRVAAVGFDIAQANRLETLNGRVTGRLLGPIRSPASKLALLRQLTRVLRLRAAETLAEGDGANDLPMLRAAGLGVAFRPAPRRRSRPDRDQTGRPHGPALPTGRRQERLRVELRRADLRAGGRVTGAARADAPTVGLPPLGRSRGYSLPPPPSGGSASLRSGTTSFGGAAGASGTPASLGGAVTCVGKAQRHKPQIALAVDQQQDGFLVLLLGLWLTLAATSGARPTSSWPTSTITSPGRRLSAPAGPPSLTSTITTPLTASGSS